MNLKQLTSTGPWPTVVAVAAVLAAGCATPPSAPPSTQPAPPPTPADTQRRSDFDRSLDRWQGAPLSEVRGKLGKPDAVTRQPDGTTLYAFTRSTGPGQGKFSCTVRFVVDTKTQRVQGHQIEGC